MVSSSTVMGDASSFSSIMSNYSSSIGEVSGVWQGASSDNLQQKASTFFSEYESTITSQMSAFSEAVELYEKYKIEKKNVEISKQNYNAASSANDSSKMADYQREITSHQHAQEQLKAQIEAALETASNSKLEAVNYSFNNEFINYYQYNYENPYGGGTIRTWGCGPTSLAMVLTYLLGEEVSPVETAAKGNGTYTCSSGTTWDYFPAMAQEYGVHCEEQAVTTNNIVESLQAGKPLIMSMAPGHFTKAGHFIVLRGIDENGQIIVADPNSEERSNTRGDVDVFLNEGRTMWAMSNE